MSNDGGDSLTAIGETIPDGHEDKLTITCWAGQRYGNLPENPCVESYGQASEAEIGLEAAAALRKLGLTGHWNYVTFFLRLHNKRGLHALQRSSKRRRA